MSMALVQPSPGMTLTVHTSTRLVCPMPLTYPHPRSRTHSLSHSHAADHMPHARRAVSTHGWSTAIAASASPQAALHSDPQPLDVTIRMACGSAELRAAAYLRAASFYAYPPGRSEWAERSHRRMKADAEWDALSSKVEGCDTTYKHLRVTPFIATIPDDPECQIAQQATLEMDLSSKLPADGHVSASVVVGTLDLNQGRSLPAEELQGKWPHPSPVSPSDRDQQGDPDTQRAYLSNVCVSKAVRRRGLARKLIQEVEAYAHRAGVTHMYVHVVADNKPAVDLYMQALGYQIEAQESEAYARNASRPRRLMLCKRL